MKTIIKELLDEFIQYKTTKKPIKYLDKAHEELGLEEIYSLVQFLLQWHKEVFLNLAEPDKFEISAVLYKRYSPFFELIPTLNDVFVLNENHIVWNLKLSNDDQEEIRNYINENYTIQLRIRRDLNRR